MSTKARLQATRKKLKQAKKALSDAKEVSKQNKKYKSSNHINKQKEALRMLQGALSDARDAWKAIKVEMNAAMTALREDPEPPADDWFQMSHEEVREAYCSLCGYRRWIDEDGLCLGCFDACNMTLPLTQG